MTKKNKSDPEERGRSLRVPDAASVAAQRPHHARSALLSAFIFISLCLLALNTMAATATQSEPESPFSFWIQ